MGSDNMALFDRWSEYEFILEHYPILVYPREGDDLEMLKKRFPEMKVIEAPLFRISATEIREQLRQGKTSPWLAQEVAEMLK
ncbi:MAG: nicotinic acid mononucleotide adenylyltransferase, partial [Paludibacteraceae bacterium]|nr:nicotinic acid mononucleotide adenylyltransferase [Paludibacteraceae bacterium]